PAGQFVTASVSSVDQIVFIKMMVDPKGPLIAVKAVFRCRGQIAAFNLEWLDTRDRNRHRLEIRIWGCRGNKLEKRLDLRAITGVALQQGTSSCGRSADQGNRVRTAVRPALVIGEEKGPVLSDIDRRNSFTEPWKYDRSPKCKSDLVLASRRCFSF